MSLQTGVETPRGPASRQLGDRVRYRVTRFKAEPNPIWMREMRQAARLIRTPVILLVITILMTLVMASLGGVMVGTTSPAKTGNTLFHVFFSVAYFVVTLVGPGLAANSIASEREGHTWEALLLTGMRPAKMTRGKFLSAYTAIAMYIVMLAPVGAITFLFGGITPIEVIVAFFFLFLFALLAVAFGLAISSKMQSLRMALLVTLLLAVPISIFVFGLLGVGLSLAAHELWDGIVPGAPVWLPTAYSRATFGLEYVVYLFVLPITVISLPAWFLYSVTNANLTSITDDRSHGIKRWYIATAIILTIAASIPMFAMKARDRGAGLLLGMCLIAGFVLFCSFLFVGEAIGPSRRVKQIIEKTGRWRRFLSPSVTKTAKLQLGGALISFALLTGLGMAYIELASSPRSTRQIEMIVIFAAYCVGFSIFLVGLSSYLRARAKTIMVARVLLLVFLFVIAAGPWIIGLISGAFARSLSSTSWTMALASPSPFYVFVAIETLGRSKGGVAVVASMACSIGYGVLGFGLLALAGARCRKIIRDHEAILAEADRRLADEDRYAAEQAASYAEQATAQAEQPAAAEAPPQGWGPEETDGTAGDPPGNAEDAPTTAADAPEAALSSDEPADGDGNDDAPSEGETKP